MILGSFGKRDALNRKGGRGIRNTKKRLYNCGGYALETFNWYLPYEKQDRGILFNPCEEISLEDTLNTCVSYMLKEFKNELRIINGIDELNENEYAIAFKAGEDDFHYAKRGRNGKWFHKMGGLSRIRLMTFKEVMGETWNYGEYTSKTVLFAKKRV